MTGKITVRTAEKSDVGIILSLIKELAVYEKMEGEVKANEKLLTEQLFDRKAAQTLLVSVNGQEVGFALYFFNFSTFEGRAGLYLEDLYVSPQYRGLGCGKALMEELASIAAKNQCPRFEWTCLEWNKPSIGFYLGLGAKPMEGWSIYRLSGDALKKMAEGKKKQD